MEFADLTDKQRRNLRRILELTGCLKCPSLVTRQGRNCNTYACKRGLHCSRLADTIHQLKLIEAGTGAIVAPGPAPRKEGSQDAQEKTGSH